MHDAMKRHDESAARIDEIGVVHVRADWLDHGGGIEDLSGLLEPRAGVIGRAVPS